MPGGRDWDSLRGAEPASPGSGRGRGTGEARWVPVEKSQASQSAGSAGDGERVNPGFQTDVEISAARAGGKASDGVRANRRWDDRSDGRELSRWDDPDAAPLEDAGDGLEELEPQRARSSKGGSEPWDQFKANERLFGVVSTFKEDLSQYTTPLKISEVPLEVRRKAERIAKDIDRSGFGTMEHDGGQCDDEEALWSSVARTDAAPASSDGSALFGAAVDGGAGGSLLAALRANAPTSGSDGTSSGGYRSNVDRTVKAWWRARKLSGEVDLPPGTEDALVCPFSRRVFGDVSQLVTHWAAALPRDEATAGSKFAVNPCPEATEQFQQVGVEITWAQIAKSADLESLLSVEKPKAGSVWAEVITRLTKSTKSPTSNGTEHDLAERPAGEFVAEAVRLKMWRRDQKVEHREVLEALAAGFAIHILGEILGESQEEAAKVAQDSVEPSKPGSCAAESLEAESGGGMSKMRSDAAPFVPAVRTES